MKWPFSHIPVRRLLWLFIVGGCAARMLDCFCFNPIDNLGSDSLRHWMNGKRFLNPAYMQGYDPIFYQVYMFLLQGITGGNRYAIALATGLLSTGMPWTYYRAGRELGLSVNRSLFLWTLIVWMPSLFLVYEFFMMETLLLFLIGLSLWMTGRQLRKGTLSSFLVATAAWTLTCLTKTIPAPLAAVCLAYGWWKRSRKVSHALAALALAIAMLIPNTVRTYRLMGFPAPFGNTWLPRIHHQAGTKYIRIERGKAAWTYSSPSCYIQPLAPLSPWMIDRAYDDSTVRVRIEWLGDQDWHRIYDEIRVSWGDWLTRWIENMALFLFAPPWPDCYTGTWTGVLNYWLRWIWAPIIFFLAEENFRQFLRRCFHLIPVATTVFTLWLFSQNIVTMEGRFRKPLEPILLLNLAWAIQMPRKSP
jgi:hypothetical protein